MEPSLEQNIVTHYTYLICAQYLRILFSSFGEEDFQRFALNLLCSNCCGYYFADNVGSVTI